MFWGHVILVIGIDAAVNAKNVGITICVWTPNLKTTEEVFAGPCEVPSTIQMK